MPPPERAVRRGELLEPAVWVLVMGPPPVAPGAAEPAGPAEAGRLKSSAVLQGLRGPEEASPQA